MKEVFDKEFAQTLIILSTVIGGLLLFVALLCFDSNLDRMFKLKAVNAIKDKIEFKINTKDLANLLE